MCFAIFKMSLAVLKLNYFVICNNDKTNYKLIIIMIKNNN